MDKEEIKKLKAQIASIKGSLKALSIEAKKLEREFKEEPGYGLWAKASQLESKLKDVCEYYWMKPDMENPKLDPMAQLENLRKRVENCLGTRLDLNEMLGIFQFSPVLATVVDEVKMGRQLEELRRKRQEGQDNG